LSGSYTDKSIKQKSETQQKYLLSLRGGAIFPDEAISAPAQDCNVAEKMFLAMTKLRVDWVERFLYRQIHQTKKRNPTGVVQSGKEIKKRSFAVSAGHLCYDEIGGTAI
jgi:hypothetical protein